MEIILAILAALAILATLVFCAMAAAYLREEQQWLELCEMELSTCPATHVSQPQ